MLKSLVAAIVWVYLFALGSWAVCHTVLDDRHWWLFLLNAAALYLFVPLPAALLLAVLLRRRFLLLGSVAGVALFLFVYGVLWLPKNAPAAPRGIQVTAMTYNILGYSNDAEGVVRAIRASHADVIALQELNPWTAAAVRRELRTSYPYQLLEPRINGFGMGLISRYPLRSLAQSIGGSWLAPPQVARLSLHGDTITVLNLHTKSMVLGSPASIASNARQRENAMREVVRYTRLHPGPLIMLSDLNAGDQSSAYAILAQALHDAWRVAGWGSGATFPGADSPGSARPRIAGILLPMWLFRIDYVFYAPPLQALNAWIGPWDGVSDHRPVVARLLLPQAAR